MAPKKSSGCSGGCPFTKGYLVLYNLVQFLGWSYVLFQVVDHYLNNHSFQELWPIIAFSLSVFQTAALLEIVHAALGLVSSNPVLTAVQVYSRVFLVWPILHLVQPSQVSVGLPMLLLAWTVTEIIRYLFYALSLLGSVPSILLWLRYTFFIFLYPIGVTGELLCCYAAIPFYMQTGLFSLTMPNVFNLGFYFPYFLIFTMLSYIPVFPQLYLHMFAQRKKILGSPKKDAAKKA